MKESALSLNERITHYRISYFQIVHMYLKTVMTDLLLNIDLLNNNFEDFCI